MGKLDKVKYKIEDHMLLGSVYDNIMMKTKYRNKKLSFLYNVMVAQKHRMLYYKQLRRKYMDRQMQCQSCLGETAQGSKQ